MSDSTCRCALALLALVGACGTPKGHVIAKLTEEPTAIVAVGDTLVIRTKSDDPTIHAPTVDSFYRMPIGGGELKLIAHLPGGSFEIDDNTLYVGTEFGGDVYAINLDQGAPRVLAKHVATEIHGLAVVDGAVIILGLDRNVDSSMRFKAVRVDRASGDISDLPTTNGAERLNSELKQLLKQVRRGDVTYMTSLDGATVRVRRNGSVDVIRSPAGFSPCFAADSTTLWWIQEEPKGPDAPAPSPILYSAPIAGGPMARLPDAGTRNEAGDLPCVANDDTLFFMKGKDIASRDHDGTIRTVATTGDLTSMLYADQAHLMWGETLSEGSYTIRAISLH
jgi:hypothetical protein